MKQEPEWIDIIALIAMYSLLKTAPKNATSEDIAYEAYAQAEAMIDVRKKFNSEGQSDEPPNRYV
jgi:hypothetical protein